jgi:hypothetical protein
MNHVDIPQTQWGQFCESFTRHYHGRAVGMRQLDTCEPKGGEPRKQAPDRLFPGARALQEVREGSTDAYVEVMVTVGEGTDETSFLIEDVVALSALGTADADQGLRVDSANGKATLIELQVAE